MIPSPSPTTAPEPPPEPPPPSPLVLGPESIVAANHRCGPVEAIILVNDRSDPPPPVIIRGGVTQFTTSDTFEFDASRPWQQMPLSNRYGLGRRTCIWIEIPEGAGDPKGAMAPGLWYIRGPSMGYLTAGGCAWVFRLSDFDQLMPADWTTLTP